MLPANSPWKVYDLVCSRCAGLMRREFTRGPRLTRVLYYCDTETCRYVWEPQLEYAQGMAGANYTAPPPVPGGRTTGTTAPNVVLVPSEFVPGQVSPNVAPAPGANTMILPTPTQEEIEAEALRAVEYGQG